MIRVKGTTFIILSCVPFVILQYAQPLAEKIWRQRCIRNSIVLNDCNLCRCGSNTRYTCDARVCGLVDKFGHFNDAIQDISVGMEGHGYWRIGQVACEPGVHYQLGEVLCVCALDGTWPNPVCRDSLQVLHSVEVVQNFTISPEQNCTQGDIYVSGCNACVCPNTGYVDPKKCTNRNCTLELEMHSQLRTTDLQEIKEVYAQCEPEKKYKLGCRNCDCLKNNRLICQKCNAVESTTCEGRKVGESFMVECNLCFCGKQGEVHCSLNDCRDIEKEKLMLDKAPFMKPIARSSIRDIDCQPGRRYNKGCNVCYCFQPRMVNSREIKKFGCTVEKCPGQEPIECEVGVIYNKPCLRCRCRMLGGNKMEVCEGDPSCSDEYYKKVLRLNSNNEDPIIKDSIKDGIITIKDKCEPMQIYKEGCTTCVCLPDGETLACTKGDCKKPVTLNIIPVVQKLPHCRNGQFFQIDCNHCTCLAGGNALCTANNCYSNDNKK